MEKTLTVAEIAKQLDRDRSTVLRWIQSGKFPNARLEKSRTLSYWVVPASDIAGFIKPIPGPKKT